MKKETKKYKIKLLADHLTKLNPSFKNIYVCPLCLSKVPIEKTHKISEAHIIPKAAGGILKTFLCHRCNSFLGANQDKWFGELTNLFKNNESLIERELTGRNFIFNNEKYSGKWYVRENGNFVFLFDARKNSPKDLEYFREYFKSQKIKLSIQYPILTKGNLIPKGYLTAAYLYCFLVFGYSWVRQSYLDSLRHFILSKEEVNINRNQFIFVNEKISIPFIGITIVDTMTYFVFGFNNVLSLLPTFSTQEILPSINEEIKKRITNNILQLNFIYLYEKKSFPLILYYDKVIIKTDKIRMENLQNEEVLFITNDGINLMKFCNDEEYEKIKGDKKIEIKELEIKI